MVTKKKVVSKKARAKAITAKSKARRKPANKPPQKRSTGSNGESKMSKAEAIYKRLKNKPRKDIIAAFMSEAGLTKAGASTYHSVIKKKLS